MVILHMGGGINLIVFINNRDSFVWNLVDYASRFDEDTHVLPNTTDPEKIMAMMPDGIILSPGPGTPYNPRDVGCSRTLVNLAIQEKVPLLGVCLGAQVLAVELGGRVSYSPEGPVHGKASPVHHDGKGVFTKIQYPLIAGRYHSLAILDVPKRMEVSATSGELVMGIRVRGLPIEGVQFHPESVLTPDGIKLIENFVGMCREDKEEKKVEM
ncbi:MAG: anthranilate synthase component II [Methermicoccaceae archaeon]